MTYQHRGNTLRVVLIKPSKYDDGGYVIRFWRGVLPSNTLSVLLGLTTAIKTRKELGEVRIEIACFDETAQRIPVKRITRWSRPGTKVVVGLVGVQTNQFPRALDLGRQFRAAGLEVLMGGFHISGTMTMLGEAAPDIQALVREGIIAVAGEIEDAWGNILRDALHGRLKPVYSLAQDLRTLVNMGEADVPVFDQGLMGHFADPLLGTLDTSRGCPFSCSFCTVINVQGRTVRERTPEAVAAFVRRNYREKGIKSYFFTDDNFARKKYWRETFEALIQLQREGVRISFLMQVDLARKPRDFVQLAADAGCAHVFIGMESVNPDNLSAKGKRQNKVEEYARIVKDWHDVNVAVQAGYIIGLPHDTKESVALDLQFLMNDIQPDWASFFILTPLPGSRDHQELTAAGAWMDPDLNRRDTFHVTVGHPLMTGDEWNEAYREAWRTFYSKENLVRILSRWSHHPRQYWGMLWVLFWYRHSALTEQTHPMLSGLIRFKDRTTRRPGLAIERLPVHMWNRTKECSRILIEATKLLKEFEDIWLRTRKPSETERKWIREAIRIQGEIYRRLRIPEWQLRYRNARDALPAQAKEVLDPFENLTAQVFASGRDLGRFMTAWQHVQNRLQELAHRVPSEGEPVHTSLLELRQILGIPYPADKMNDWMAAYRRLKHTMPNSLRFAPVRFDALTDQVVSSRQELNSFWTATVREIRAFRFSRIRPMRLLAKVYQDLGITARFATQFLMNRG